MLLLSPASPIRLLLPVLCFGLGSVITAAAGDDAGSGLAQVQSLRKWGGGPSAFATRGASLPAGCDPRDTWAFQRIPSSWAGNRKQAG
jgi:hypothetical protein